MSVGPAGEAPTRASRAFDAAVSVGGVLVAALALLAVVRTGDGVVEVVAAVALAIPLILFLGYFEVSLGSTLPSPNEPYVTFESAVLVFLACTVDLDVALLAWVAGQTVLNGSARISQQVRLFNIGLMICSGALALRVVSALGGVPGEEALETGRTVATIAAGSLTYLVSMYAVLMTSVALESRIPLLEAIGVRPALRALGALCAINGIGLLSAILVAELPLWTLTLLLGPVVAVLLTTRALSRAAEQRQRLGALFDATKQIQLSSTYDDIIAVLREQAPKILGTGGAELRGRPPSGTDFGVQVRNARGELWVVGTGLNRLPGRRQADLDALQALATVVEEALLRTSLAEEMSRMAHHDSLTSLPNRALFLDRAELAVAEAGRAGRDVGVLFDEFAVLVEQVPSVDRLLELGERIIDALSAALPVRGHEASVGASIGIALAGPADDADALIRHADRAMYDAKSNGKNQCRLYRSPLAASAATMSPPP